MIKYVFIDLDNTILDFNKAEGIALKKTIASLGGKPSDYMAKRYSEINLSQWKRLERGEITRNELKVNRYRLLFEEFDIDASPKSATDIYEGFLSQGHYFIDGAEELLKTLKKSYKLFLVSNGTLRVQQGRLDSAGIRPCFDGIFISEEVGADKPSKEFFDGVFCRIGNVDKSECIIVGDSLTSDIQGGINAGIKTLWFNRKNEENNTKIKPDFEACKLKEIPEIIKKI